MRDSQLTLRVVELLQAWQPSVIKGNAAEIGALAESAEVSLNVTPKTDIYGGSDTDSTLS